MKPGDHVHVTSLGTGILREIRNGRRCLVEIKGRAMLVDESQLSPIDARKARAKASAPEAAAVPEGLTRSYAATSIDLHGKTTDEAASAVDAFVNDAILAGHAEVRVIHGRTGGRLKSAVHARLKGIRSVRAFRLDPANPGVTIVNL